jgi:hypothetical protein
LQTEKEWRAEFGHRGFSTVQLQYMNGNFFHGPARSYVHKWLGEQEAADKRRSLANLRWARTAAVCAGLAVVLALIQLIITWRYG